MAAHRQRDGFDLGSDLGLAARLQALDIAGQHLQRRAQAMGKVAGAGAGAFHLRLAGGKQAVQLAGERADLVGKIVAQARAAAGADSGEPVAHGRKRRRPTETCATAAAIRNRASTAR